MLEYERLAIRMSERRGFQRLADMLAIAADHLYNFPLLMIMYISLSINEIYCVRDSWSIVLVHMLLSRIEPRAFHTLHA